MSRKFNIALATLSDDDLSRLEARYPRIQDCPTCNGNGKYTFRGESHQCDCHMQKQLHKHYLNAGIGTTYQRLDWFDYEGDKSVLEALLRYIEGYERYSSRGIGLLLTGSYGTGKCVEVGSLVNMADGTYRPVEQVWAGDEVVGGTVVASQSNGRRSVFRIKTTWGHELSLTSEHPVWVVGRGWVPASQLQAGDELRSCGGWEPLAPEDGPDELYRLIGYLVADGSVSQAYVGWSKTNPLIVSDFVRCAESQGFSVHHRGGCDYRVTGISKSWREKFLGLYKSLSREKVVPPFVLRSSNAKAVQFLTAYLESDGHGLEFFSASRLLLSGVQGLLTRLGVPSHLRSKAGTYKGERHYSWRLSVLGNGRNMLSGWSFVDDKNRPSPLFAEPDFVEPGFCQCGCGGRTSRVVKRGKGYEEGDYFRYIHGHHRSRINAERSVANSVLRVAEVEEVPDVHTWSLQVEPTNHLWISDILTHNTLLANLILKEFVKLGYRSFATTFAQTIDMLTAGWKSNEDRRYFQRRFVDSEVLLLDDVGRELRSKSNLTESTFDTILRTRVQEGRPTFITTNMSPEELGDGYGSAVLSLLKEHSIVCEMVGDDFRSKSNARTLKEIRDGETRPIC